MHGAGSPYVNRFKTMEFNLFNSQLNQTKITIIFKAKAQQNWIFIFVNIPCLPGFSLIVEFWAEKKMDKNSDQ